MLYPWLDRFILSQEITSGGLAGITTIIQIATDIPATIPYNIINVGLLVLALVFLGWKFTVHTAIGVGMIFVTFPIGQALFTPADSEVYAKIWPWLKELVPNVGPLLSAEEPFLALVLGSMLCGLGLGLVFSVNGSTGGTDVIVAIINKYKNISLGRAMIMVDAVIVVSGCLVSHYAKGMPWGMALGKLAYSFVEIIIVAQTMDFFLNSNKQSIQFFINSLKYEQINDAIINKLNRGCTIIEAQGGYSKNPAKILMVVARKSMRKQLMEIVREIDPKAFVSEGIVHGVYGEGFDTMRREKK
ncbi:YitT family protein [Porphyromonas gingivicanis]|uniref:YitT family protein n=1 Tax=Porphyromonas gingivicanis TaxID=266762 RepID=UPI000AB28CC1|nr:YitT family protein [Porphyromonas gingivicanis]